MLLIVFTYVMKYEVRDLFPWEILTKIMKLGTNKLKLDLKLLPKNVSRRNHFHREIDLWNRRRFGAKWNVTVPNSVTPIKPIVCEWMSMSEEWYFQMTRELRISEIFIGIYVKLWFWAIFVKFMTKNAVFCRLVQQELNVAYETGIFRSMFMGRIQSLYQNSISDENSQLREIDA